MSCLSKGFNHDDCIGGGRRNVSNNKRSKSIEQISRFWKGEFLLLISQPSESVASTFYSHMDIL